MGRDFEEINRAKHRLREEMKEKLKELTGEEYQSFNQRLIESFFKLEVVQHSTTVMLYHSIRKEASTIALISQLLSQGKIVGLPICTEARSLKVGRIIDLDQVRPKMVGPFCLMEPAEETPLLEPSELELIVLPGLAFDRAGHRLGYGGGYYDRFLGEYGGGGFRLGLAYPFQMLANVPSTAHDVSMDGLLTPCRYYDFHQKS